MSIARWLETDSLSNQNISSAAVVGAYTADADRMVICDVSLDQVAGGGDYAVYLTRQINGAGSAYVLLPKTTCTAAAGETALAMQSGMVSVRSGDVLTVYLDGLAGDTTTPDTIVRWFELAALQPTTPGRTLVVDGFGQVTVGAMASGTVTAAAIATGAIDADALAADVGTEISSAVLSALGSAGNLDTQLSAINAKTTNLPASPAAVGSPMALADDAITAAKFDESTAFPLKQADTGSTAVARTGADGDTLETLSDQIDGVGAGTGTGTYTDTVTDGVDPLDNVLVQLSTDSAGANMAYRAYTGADGVFVMHPDPGTYYVWLELAGYSFTQGAEVVVT